VNDYDFDDNEFPLAYLITIRCLARGYMAMSAGRSTVTDSTPMGRLVVLQMRNSNT